MAYTSNFYPFVWKNESERPYITVSGNTEEVLVDIPQLAQLDIVPNSRSKIRDSWFELCYEVLPLYGLLYWFCGFCLLIHSVTTFNYSIS